MATVAIVGGSLPGIAAAARLAKARHRVVLVDAADRLGGRWADPAIWPATLALPAAWRDLFRKSGRLVDAELAATGHELAAAPAIAHRLPAGELVLPTERGTQAAMLTRQFGAATADAWRDTLDLLDGRWQLLRRLGLEHDTEPDRDLRRRLAARPLDGSLATLGRRLGPLAPLAAQPGWPDEPRRVPAWFGARLAVDRTFGRWRVLRDGQPAGNAVLLELLVARLDRLGVDVRLGTAATGRSATAVATTAGPIAADVVIDATSPWSGLARPPRGLRPGLAPAVATEPCSGEEIETVDHAARTVSHSVATPTGWLRVTHDFGHPHEDPGTGVAWRGERSWLRRPPLAGPDGVLRASAASRGGAEPWAQLLTGALAAYAAQERLGGASLRPVDDPRTRRAR